MSKKEILNISALLHLDLESQNIAPPERILVAALRLFVKQGYFNTNVPDLSRESKCSVGSIYHHFKNKEEVAQALYDTGIKYFRASLDDQLEKLKTPEQIIKRTVSYFLEFTEHNPELSKYLWLARHNEFMSGIIKHPTMVGFDKLGRVLTRALKQGIRTDQIRSLKANVIWSILFGVPLSYARDWLDGYNLESPSRVAESLADACYRALAT